MHLRVARPTDRLEEISAMYRDGLGFELLGSFDDHEGFDGVMLGHRDLPYHLEFTHHRGTSVGLAPTEDHLLAFYLPDQKEWSQKCEQMHRAGFQKVASYNPYWDQHGLTFEDLDGYRVVLQNADWPGQVRSGQSQ